MKYGSGPSNKLIRILLTWCMMYVEEKLCERASAVADCRLFGTVVDCIVASSATGVRVIVGFLEEGGAVIGGSIGSFRRGGRLTAVFCWMFHRFDHTVSIQGESRGTF